MSRSIDFRHYHNDDYTTFLNEDSNVFHGKEKYCVCGYIEFCFWFKDQLYGQKIEKNYDYITIKK